MKKQHAFLPIILAGLASLAACSSPRETEPSAEARAREYTDGLPSVLDVASGRIIRWDSVASRHVAPRTIDIWVPDGILTRAEQTETGIRQDPVKVLYMHDGQMLFDSSGTWNSQEWGVDEAMSSLIKEGRIKPAIVVGIWNAAGYRWSDYAPEAAIDVVEADLFREIIRDYAREGVRSNGYLRFIREELMPMVEEAFHVATGPSNTAVAGSSMGGLISLYAGIMQPETFGRIGAISTHWPVVSPDRFPDPDANPLFQGLLDLMENRLPHADSSESRFYFDYGTETLDRHYAPYQRHVDMLMMRKGYSREDWRSMVVPGAAHDERSWAARLETPLEFLLQ